MALLRVRSQTRNRSGNNDRERLFRDVLRTWRGRLLGNGLGVARRPSSSHYSSYHGRSTRYATHAFYSFDPSIDLEDYSASSSGFHPHLPGLKYKILSTTLGATMWFFIFYRARCVCAPDVRCRSLSRFTCITGKMGQNCWYAVMSLQR